MGYLLPDAFDSYSELDFMNMYYKPYENKEKRIYNGRLNQDTFQNEAMQATYAFTTSLIIYPINEEPVMNQNYLIGFYDSILMEANVNKILYDNILKLKPTLLLPEKTYSTLVKIPFVAA